MMTMLRPFACVLFVLVAMLAPAVDAHAKTASSKQEAASVAAVKRLTDEVIGIISDESLDLPAREKALKRVFEDNVDVEWVARFVIGANWRTATEEQKKRYLAAYSPYIIKTYARRFNEYTGETIDILSSRSESDGSSMVAATIHRSNQPDIGLQFRVGDIKGRRRIMDIVVEGVSQLNTQRSEFNSVISRKGLDYLIGKLEERANSGSSTASSNDGEKPKPVF